MWDFINKQLIGSIKYKRTLYGLGKFYKSTINIDITKNSGQSGAYIEFNGDKKDSFLKKLDHIFANNRL